MNRPIETVVAEAQKRLETSGRLDIATYLSAYPEHAVELQELLPVMLSVHEENRWQQAEVESQRFALSLFAQLIDQPDTATVGSLFQHERAVAGLTLEEQARRSGLPVHALERLAQDRTPAYSASNASLKELAIKLTAPFGLLAKEVRRLLSIEMLAQRGSGGAVFTRHNETSTTDEQQALLEQVREAARKPPEEKS